MNRTTNLVIAFCIWLPSTIAAANEVLIEAAAAIATSANETEVYVVINNPTTSDVQVVAAESDSAGTAVFHDRFHTVRTAGFFVPIHSELYMQPGGVHIAIMGEPLSPGMTLPLVLSFSDQSAVELTVRLVASPDQIADHHDYDHEATSGASLSR
jgi:copper(I)-binding protein